MLYNGIDITVDLEVLRFWGAKIRSIVRTKAMYKSEFTLGIWIDGELSFKTHIDKLTKK